MRGPKKERWMRLCQQIAEEQDPVRFSELVKELLAELDAKDKRLKTGTAETRLKAGTKAILLPRSTQRK